MEKFLRKPNTSELKDARPILEYLYNKYDKPSEEREEYEEMVCECPMTGTIEIMRRKIEKSE